MPQPAGRPPHPDLGDAGQKGQKLVRAVPACGPSRELLTPAQVAAQLGLCRETVYRLIAQGELVAARVGSALRVSASDLAAYLESSVTPPRASTAHVRPGTAGTTLR